MSVTCVPIYSLMFRILTRFHALYFGASCIHRTCNAIVWRRNREIRKLSVFIRYFENCIYRNSEFLFSVWPNLAIV